MLLVRGAVSLLDVTGVRSGGALRERDEGWAEAGAVGGNSAGGSFLTTGYMRGRGNRIRYPSYMNAP
ncbi:hypothetical protein CBQ26_04830 [Deinococcus indicus]|uniref:Uncharacterized protein n=1 Tax=Deinococcus indicus TaxID=223556 RepID=A0A246BPL8_9DEIO|nr:hypothetical protein CBQ26_04830 [Deinococcus indicus]GHG29063.1 hypothetical protein GCM10017784_22250 [Deinococcus indicus]